MFDIKVLILKTTFQKRILTEIFMNIFFLKQV